MKLVFILQDAVGLEAAFELLLKSTAVAACQEPPLPSPLLDVVRPGIDGTVGEESPTQAWAASPALPAGLGTQHLQYFAGLSSTLLRLRSLQQALHCSELLHTYSAWSLHVKMWHTAHSWPTLLLRC